MPIRPCRAALCVLVMMLGALPAGAQLLPQVTAHPKKPPAKRNPAKTAPAKPTEIVVLTSPEAQVYLDDAFKGQASPEGRLVIANPSAGEHTLRVSLSGKRDYEQKITVVAGQTANVQATLTDLSGSIGVHTSPGAEVFLDNSSKGTASQSGQLVIPDVAGGDHALRITSQGKKDFQQSVRVVAGQESRVEATLADIEKPKPIVGTAQVNAKDGLKYVWIPPGSFMMGCSPGDNECFDEEKLSHRVTLSKGFWMGQTPVTVGAYKRYAVATGKPMPSEPNLMGRALNSGWSNDAMPIVDVTWDEAQGYCGWSGGRLPTEAEWEYAARAGSTESRYGPLDEVAWYADNSGNSRLDSTLIWNTDQKNYLQRLKENGNGMREVGQKRANGFGLYDMLGNVWQWVNDWYDQNYYQNSPSQDAPGPASGTLRVLRGGSWFVGPRLVRVSSRLGLDPGGRYVDFGSRCVGEVVVP